MSNGNVSMSGTVSATTGKIGGWNIANDKLYNGNVSMSATSGDSYLGFNTATWLGNNSIYIGSGSQGPRFGVSGSNGIYIGSKSGGGNRLSLLSETSKLLWDGSALSIASPNFVLSTAGNITAKGGTIAAWSIGADSMSATTGLSSLILRNEPSPAWDIVDSGGYKYSW